jgi:hypothetical protein
VLDIEILGESVELVVVEGLMRLPALPGVERPPGITAHAGRVTDMSLFRQVTLIE